PLRTSVQAALEALKGIGPGRVSVTGTSGGPYTVTFQGSLGHQDVAQLQADASKLVHDQVLVYDAATGELDFSFDVGTSVQISRPFSLSLSDLLNQLFGGGSTSTLKDVLSSIVGVSATGQLSVNAQATLSIRLGLDLSTVAISTAT